MVCAVNIAVREKIRGCVFLFSKKTFEASEQFHLDSANRVF
jgi:hypothetical protein